MENKNIKHTIFLNCFILIILLFSLIGFKIDELAKQTDISIPVIIIVILSLVYFVLNGANKYLLLFKIAIGMILLAFIYSNSIKLIISVTNNLFKSNLAIKTNLSEIFLLNILIFTILIIIISIINSFTISHKIYKIILISIGIIGVIITSPIILSNALPLDKYSMLILSINNIILTIGIIGANINKKYLNDGYLFFLKEFFSMSVLALFIIICGLIGNQLHLYFITSSIM